MGKRFGYGRVSTADQDLSIQAEALERAGCIASFLEKKSGTTTEGREELRRVLSILGEGDELVVVRLDRLARSVADLADIVRQIEKKRASLRCVEQPVDTSTSAGRAFVGMLAVFAEFETGLRRERQMEGIAKAKREGKYKGRPRMSVSAEVRRLNAEGKGPTAIAKELGIGVATVHRRLAEMRSA
jgi:DNA invertase Pin-like site-specific DNA recombinase